MSVDNHFHILEENLNQKTVEIENGILVKFQQGIQFNVPCKLDVIESRILQHPQNA